MKIELDWYEPMELGSSSTLKENVKNFDFSLLPEISGVYIFYREYSNYQEALYVGKSENIRTRMKAHFNSMKLIDGLIDTPKGQKKLIYAKVKTRSDLAKALAQAEKGLINQLDDEKHPLLNRKLMKDQYDYIISKGNALSIIDEEIPVFSSKV
ncbi:GIY-YIG nuclease family protein [Acinetobacter sp. 12966]|uniref:GIY-YIG nuclease family protein n=1 Tax=Acinetobacter TaxID=469 RepID=UPI001022FF21|nr:MULTISPECIES: GIY-YIG nuclease family protein [Acinetobacter]MDA4923158.1 GIY-YIG nuclease family protein [Acinetobacter baumannii]MDQ9949054.1 GIY-YIG nuclease family protein [Acinetobacter sp. 12966]MDV7451466.1 GIY-YIG nuclease family protein [Acinetobacter baumannii]RZH14306.1 GIY-YIG nuclease family protein [Acinetobacter pittii]TPU92013.1 GIY-YIG nuclease family protein [Acinetobacter baumannii]